MVLKKKKKVNEISLISIHLSSYFVEGEKQPEPEEEEEKKEEDDWKPYIPETPSAALFAVYTSPDTFWLSMVCLISFSCLSFSPNQII